MSVLDLIFVGLLSSAILFLLFGCLYLFFSLSTGKKVKGLKKRKVKNKQKRKKWLRACRKLEKKKRHQRTGWLLCWVLCLMLGAGAGYARYYQLTKLDVEDIEALAKSYYLTDELTKQLEALDNGASVEKTTKNLVDLTSQLGSITVRNAPQGLSVERQQVLSRHFALLKDISVNISTLRGEALENADLRRTYLTDLEKVKKQEQEVFKLFAINESALKQN